MPFIHFNEYLIIKFFLQNFDKKFNNLYCYFF